MYHWSETLFSMCGLGFVLEARLIASQSYLSIQCFSEYRIPLPLVENLGTFSDARYFRHFAADSVIFWLAFGLGNAAFSTALDVDAGLAGGIMLRGDTSAISSS